MDLDDWFLTPRERGNPVTTLDTRHRDGRAWSSGNRVTALLHGSTYFASLLAAVRDMRADDQLFFADWRGDPDERLDGPGTEVSRVLVEAARRGVHVRGLIWRSHLDRFRFSEEENRHLGEEIVAAGGECVLDMRVRTGGAHHQKFVVLRHVDRPERDVAFIGGIDLCHGRNDSHHHAGDDQPCPMAAIYGQRPPWHDVQISIHGPAVADIETVFRERWEDPSPLTRNLYRRWRDRRLGRPDPRPCPPRLPDPEACGSNAVQVLRTYPYRRRGYSFAPDGERSIARAFDKALRQTRQLIYLEEQYLWSPHVMAAFTEALAARPELRLLAIVPHFPDRDGRVSAVPQLLARAESVHLLRRFGPDRVGIYGLENHAGTPVYVHAKVCVMDDVWAVVGSDNLNMRSWTFDTELTCAVLDEGERTASEPGFAQSLRLALAREHLDRAVGDDADLRDPSKAFEVFARSAADLESWHARGRRGPRPPGRLRPYRVPSLSHSTMQWAQPLYRLLFDPDGRPPSLRRQGGF